MQIVLLEDELPQAALMSHWLKQAGIACVHYATANTFRAGVVHDRADLIMVDWMLPDDNGLQVLLWLRENLGNSVPVMFLSAQADDDVFLRALINGADDYMNKPLRRNQTLARIDAFARREKTIVESMLILGELRIDTTGAILNGIPVAITDEELMLARYMLFHRDRLLMHQELQNYAIPTKLTLATQELDTYVNRIRSKLKLIPENGFLLSNVFNKGYRLECLAPVSPASVSG